MIRYFWVLRAYVLRAGELTGLGDDIFFLDAAEIAGRWTGPSRTAGAIAERRAVYAALPRAAAATRR